MRKQPSVFLNFLFLFPDSRNFRYDNMTMSSRSIIANRYMRPSMLYGENKSIKLGLIGLG